MNSMCKSLLLSQLVRLLKSESEKSIQHIGYWMGELLVDFVADIDNGEHSDATPSYFETLCDLIVEARLDGILNTATWRSLTNRMIYRQYASKFAATKVENEAADSSVFNLTWKRMVLPVLASETKEIIYLVIHDKLPVKERLFRVGVGPDPYCLECLNIVGAVAVTSEHFFCTCLRVVDVWTEIKQVLNGLLPSVATTTDLDLITLKFERSQVENEMTWIIGNYLAETWKSLHIRGQARLRRESVFGFLKFKFKSEQQGARVRMKQINAFQ